MYRDESFRWSLLTPLSIDVTLDGEHWNSGRALDVLVPTSSGVVLVATETGGVWEVNQSNGAATSLSDSWTHPDIRCLVQGRLGKAHIYAGAVGALYETGQSNAPLFRDWRRADLPTSATVCEAIAVDGSKARIVIATDNGIWWTEDTQPYAWRLARISASLPADLNLSMTGVAKGASNFIATPSRGSSLYVGTWRIVAGSEELVLLPTPIPSPSAATYWHVTVATAFSVPSMAYVLCFDRKGAIAGVLRSTDDGSTWSWGSNQIVGSTGPQTLNDLSGTLENGGWQKRVHVSPDGSAVSVAGLHGFVSDDAGMSWRQLKGSFDSVPHVDHHVGYFDPNDASGRRMFLATDGGIFLTEDRGADPRKVTGALNKYLATLQCMSHGPSRGFWGTMAAGMTRQHRSTFVGLQDNGVVRTDSDGGQRWRRIRHGDGTFVGVLPAGALLCAVVGDRYTLRVEGDQWSTDIDIPIGNSQERLGTPANAQVLAREWRSPQVAHGQPEWLYAVAADDRQASVVHALVGVEQVPKVRWERVTGSLGLDSARREGATAFDAERGEVYVGTNLGRLFAISVPNFPPGGGESVYEVNTSGLGVSLGEWSRILSLPGAGRYAIVASNRGTRVLKQQSLSWVDVTTNLVEDGPSPDTSPQLFGLALSRDAVYVLSDNRVYRSLDEGASWTDVSAGLPEMFHGSDIVVAETASGPALLLGSFGRSVWTAPL